MDAFFARQPIFDRAGEVAGYELLYRGSAETDSAAGDGASMSSRLLVSAVLGHGIDEVTGGHPAFVNIPRDMLLEGLTDVLDPATTIIEILETVEPDDDVAAACARLVAAGYRLALDDYITGDPREPLLRYAHIVKVDLARQPAAQLQELVSELHGFGARLVAEKIEDAALWNRCRDLGFDLFQGYFFRKPQLVTHRDLSAEQLHILSLFNLLQDPATTDAQIVAAFRGDVALSFKLLAMANTAAVGAAGIESIPHALRLLGRGTLARWIAVLLAASRGRSAGTRNELLRETLIRARFAECIGESGTLKSSAGSLFLVGILSHMDALLSTPLAGIIARLKLAPAVRDALLQRTGPLGPALRLVEAYEDGRWTEAEVLSADAGIQARRLPALYREAIEWMRDFAAVL